MTITNFNDPEQLEEQLKTKLTAFMEKNETFNVQGSYTDDDGITAVAIIDFGIQDRDDGEYYVASVSAAYEDNLEILDEKGLIDEKTPVDEVDNEDLYHVLGESDAYMELENAVIRAVRAVFKTQPYEVRGEPMHSDIDLCTTIPIAYSDWTTHSSIDFDRAEEVKV